jgi:hypothetical protein
MERDDQCEQLSQCHVDFVGECMGACMLGGLNG